MNKMTQISGKPWRKKYRVRMLQIAFLLFWPGFYFAYVGGTQNNPLLIAISFAFLGSAAVLAILIQK